MRAFETSDGTRWRFCMTKTAKSRAASRTKRPPLKPGGPSRWDTSWKGWTRTAKGRWRVVELKGTFILIIVWAT